MVSRFDREFSTDTKKGDVSMHVDMSPSTVLEVNLMGGYSRTTKPVGQAPADGINTNGSASRGTTDAIAATKLGLPVVNKR
jgi:hypothetical protein